MNESRFLVKVPASSANLGPGFDVLALALDMHLTVELTGKKGPLEIQYGGTLGGHGIKPENDIFLTALAVGLGCEREELTGFSIKVNSEIPLTRGLGASAAATIAGILLGNLLTGSKLSADEINQQAWAVETHPDALAAAYYGGLIFSPPGKEGTSIAHPLQLPLHPNWHFAVAWPSMEVSTQLARSVLPPSLPHLATPRTVGRTLLLLQGLKDGDPGLVKLGIEDEIHIPYRRHLVPGWEDVYQAAMDNGAAGVTLSSSGPAMVALVLCKDTGAKITEAMIEAFNRNNQNASGKLLEVAGQATVECLPPQGAR